MKPAERPYFLPYRQSSNRKALVFVHGFTEDVRTWARFAALLMADHSLLDWDLFSLGYQSKLVTWLNAQNNSLEFASCLLNTNLTIPPLVSYDAVAVVAHSVGGLLVQRALADSDSFAARLSHLFLFGTPSLGSAVAHRWRFLSRQLRDLDPESMFLRGLRKNWSLKFAAGYPFRLYAIASAGDERVSSDSVWGPFPPATRRAVTGNHDSIIQPESAGDVAFQIVREGLLSMPEVSISRPAAAAYPPPSGTAKRDRAFLSYSHRDADWLMSVESILTPVLGPGIIDLVWDDKMIPAGADWQMEIERALARTKVAVLLVTPAFLESEFILGNELPVLLDAARKNWVRLCWIAVAPVDPKVTRAHELYRELIARQAVNDKSRPLTKLAQSKLGPELVRIAGEIKRAFD